MRGIREQPSGKNFLRKLIFKLLDDPSAQVATTRGAVIFLDGYSAPFLQLRLNRLLAHIYVFQIQLQLQLHLQTEVAVAMSLPAASIPGFPSAESQPRLTDQPRISERRRVYANQLAPLHNGRLKGQSRSREVLIHIYLLEARGDPVHLLFLLSLPLVHCLDFLICCFRD